MPNLTISENLVKEVPLAPHPAHALVVYKVVKGGRTFQAELNPEEQFQEEQMGWWKRLRSDPPSYSAYAVNTNERLGLEFSKRVTLPNQADWFDLVFKLKYRVASCRRVVERLPEDPLSKLQSEIIDLVTEVVSNEEWGAIVNRFNRVADNALEQAREEINTQAAHWGFAVTSLKLERQLPEAVVENEIAQREQERETARRRAEAEAEKRRADIEHQKKIHQAALEHRGALHTEGLGAEFDEARHGHNLRKEERGHELRQLELKHQEEIRRLENENRMGRMLLENLLNDNELLKQIKAGGADATVEAFRNIAGETNSPRQLEEVFNVIRRLKQLSGGDVGGGGGAASEVQAFAGINLPAGLLSAQNGEAGSLPKVAQLLSSSFQAVGAVSYTAQEKTRLLSAMTHLAAEAMLGEEADEEGLEAFKERLRGVVAGLSFMPDELQEFIRDNYRGLKERLK